MPLADPTWQRRTHPKVELVSTGGFQRSRTGARNAQKNVVGGDVADWIWNVWPERLLEHEAHIPYGLKLQRMARSGLFHRGWPTNRISVAGAISFLLRAAVPAGGVAVVAMALYWSLRITYAEILFTGDTLTSVGRAIRLVPSNARYYVRQADLLEQTGADEKLQEAALECAVALNPRDSRAWIDLGLLAETRGRFSQGEAYLLEAARVDTTYQPRSTLANYYFRRGEREKFWRWVREALKTAPGDMAPLFRLCWSLSEDAGVILERAIPNRPETLRQYLGFFLRASRLEAAEAVAERILSHATADALPLLLAYCDRLLEGREAATATRVWNSLVTRGMIKYETLIPAQGIALTNGSFRIVPRSQGFDWRIPVVDGVTASRDERPPALRLTFSGKQPEQCEVLWQYLPLLAARSYRFSFEYQTAGIGPETGMRWEVIDLTNGPTRLAESVSLSAENWTHGDLKFTTPGNITAARLVLAYRRAPGTTRITGWISLRGLRLKATSEAASLSRASVSR